MTEGETHPCRDTNLGLTSHWAALYRLLCCVIKRSVFLSAALHVEATASLVNTSPDLHPDQVTHQSWSCWICHIWDVSIVSLLLLRVTRSQSSFFQSKRPLWQMPAQVWGFPRFLTSLYSEWWIKLDWVVLMYCSRRGWWEQLWGCRWICLWDNRGNGMFKLVKGTSAETGTCSLLLICFIFRSQWSLCFLRINQSVNRRFTPSF